MLGHPGLDEPAVADSRGVASIGASSELTRDGVVAVVKAPGHCRRMVALYPADGGDVPAVGLYPSGTLTVRLVDERGKPVVGMPLLLLPPDSSGTPWGEEWRAYRPSLLGPGPELLRERLAPAVREGELVSAQSLGLRSSPPAAPSLEIDALGGHRFLEVFRDSIPHAAWIVESDASGLATWRGLPAVDGYRWGAPAVSVFRHEPERDEPSPRAEDGSISIASSRGSADVSGSFELPPGGEVTLTGVVAVRTAVLGAFPFAAPEPPSRVVVKLFDRGTPDAARARGYEHVAIERSSWAAQDGAFEFTGVRPGRKVLRAWWREEGGHVYLADCAFHLAPGEVRDLGALSARAGASLQVGLELVDGSGTVLDPSTELQPGESPELSLGVIGWPNDPGDYPPVDELIGVRLGEELTIHGLPLGTCILDLDRVDGRGGPGGAGTSLILPREVQVETEHETRARLQVRLERRVRQGLRARFPAGERAVRCEAHFTGAPSSKALRRDLRVAAGDPSLAEGALELASGRYELYVHTDAFGAPETAASLYFSGRLEVSSGDPTPLEVFLEPAATARGVALDRAGVPRANDLLFMGCGAFLEGARPFWTHRLRTDDDGRFTVRGLIPGVRYVTSDGAEFTAGPAGAVTEVRLVW